MINPEHNEPELWETLGPLPKAIYGTSWLETEAILAAAAEHNGGDSDYLDQVLLRMPPDQRATLRNTADRLSRALSPNRLQNLEVATREGLTYKQWYEKYK